MSTSSRTSQRGSPLLALFGSNGSHTTDSSPLTSSSTTILKSIAMCFEYGDVEEAVVLDDHHEPVQIIPPETSPEILQIAPTRSTFSEDTHLLSSRKVTLIQPKARRTVNETTSKISPPINDTPSSKNTPSSKLSSSQSNTNSNNTDPTARISESTTSNNTAQKQLSLKTGMSQEQRPLPSTPSTSNTHCYTPITNITTTTGAAAGSANAKNHSQDFWNFSVRPANSAGSGEMATGDCTSNHRNGTRSNDGSRPGNDASESPLESIPNSSPTSLLLSQSAKAAASVMGAIESISNQVGSQVVKAEGFFKMGGIPAVAFCGTPKYSKESSSRRTHAMMDDISEEADNQSDVNTWEGFCWDDKKCPDFQEFDYNAFQEGKTLAEENLNDISEPKLIRSNPLVDSNVASHMRADSTDQTHGYEIRLKSTYSQQQMEMQRKQKFGRDSTPNSIQNDRNSTGRRAPPTCPPPAFGRTHPNNNRIPPKEHRNVDSSSRATSTQSLPFEYLSIPTEHETGEIQRTASEISELTMRSHGERYHRYSSDSRRMAYYAVGRIDPDSQDGSRGNRRCYFTGICVQNGTPFYAGSVQQGPRTLVVFCIPSALGLPSLDQRPLNCYSKTDRDRYLQSLPEPDTQLIEEMKTRYSVQFETLPVQVRSPQCWRIFVKFCFFSGLPIAEGEMHYRVKSSVIVFPISHHDQNDSNIDCITSHQEEISLSHEVLEAVNGEDSAGILRLPNQKTFDYLKRHYSQQSAKLNQEVFDRKNWELAMPEV